MPASAPRPVDSITLQTFTARVLQAERPVLVQFWATWCHPYRMVTLIVEPKQALEENLTSILRAGGEER